MSRSALEKLRKRMALTAYFRDFFGVDDPNDPDSVRQYYEELTTRKRDTMTRGVAMSIGSFRSNPIVRF